jgi:hypothetical protein
VKKVLLILLLAAAIAVFWWRSEIRQELRERLVASSTPPSAVSPPPSASASPTAGGDEAGAASRYARLPNAHRYDCSKVVSPTVPIADLQRSFGPNNWRASMIELLERRYSSAAWMVGTLQQPSLFDAWFHAGKGDWSAAASELGTAVHESAHIAGIQLRHGRQHVLVIGKGDKLSFPIPKTMDRSAIKSRLPAPIAELSYTSTYLEGDSGAQGFGMVLDELNAYTYSLFTAIAVADQQAPNSRISSRDGLMVFLYYVQAYLRLAREQQPETYRAIVKTPALRAATVLLNDRAECALALSAPHERLGIADESIWPHLFGKQALGELAALRAAAR